MSTPKDISREYCSVCGEPATASWRGKYTIAICPKCAFEVLPVLMARAIGSSENLSVPKLKEWEDA